MRRIVEDVVEGDFVFFVFFGGVGGDWNKLMKILVYINYNQIYVYKKT